MDNLIAYIAGAITISILLFITWEIGQPRAEDYARCRGLDKVEE